MNEKLEGIFPAVVTPMTADQDVDYETLSSFVNYLVEVGGVHGVIPLGSTGEYYALDAEERKLVAQTTLDAVSGRVPVLVGTNAGSTREVVRYSQEAQEQGAAGLLLAAPYYSLPTYEGLWEHFRVIDSEIDIPIMLYNYPGRTGVDMTPDFVMRLAELDSVRYVKESTGDISRVSEIIRRCGDRITVFCGCDTAALESLVLGAAGWVSGAINVLPKEHVELFELAVTNRDPLAARGLYYRLLPVLAMLEQSGKYTQLVKAGCELAGHAVGPPRLPLAPAPKDDVAKLAEIMPA